MQSFCSRRAFPRGSFQFLQENREERKTNSCRLVNTNFSPRATNHFCLSMCRKIKSCPVSTLQYNESASNESKRIYKASVDILLWPFHSLQSVQFCSHWHVLEIIGSVHPDAFCSPQLRSEYLCSLVHRPQHFGPSPIQYARRIFSPVGWTILLLTFSSFGICTWWRS